ncbi:hypothetical protein F5Y15DRAFT_49447 [Xylariaceae sp. FL0016]|nr:hypothetical protein F5Y15DRAFT_49447 [Xylariaceae sp. FL0016]
MLPRIWAGSRAQFRDLTRVCLSPTSHPLAGLARQTIIPSARLKTTAAAKVAIKSKGSRHQGSSHQSNQQRPRQLEAKVYGTIYVSIGFLVLNEALDWHARRDLGIRTVQDITLERDDTQKWQKYHSTSLEVFGAYVGGVEHVVAHGTLHLPPSAGWDDALETRLYSALDPESSVAEERIVLCVGALRADETEDVYVSEHGNRLTDATEDLLAPYEAFARSLGARRGGLLLLQEDGDWKSMYWDGLRWINIIYLEWQTAESMMLPCAHLEE